MTRAPVTDSHVFTIRVLPPESCECRDIVHDGFDVNDGANRYHTIEPCASQDESTAQTDMFAA